jgi:hypothetical protein
MIDYTKPVVFRKIIWTPKQIADELKLKGNRNYTSDVFKIIYDDKEFVW